LERCCRSKASVIRCIKVPLEATIGTYNPRAPGSVKAIAETPTKAGRLSTHRLTCGGLTATTARAPPATLSRVDADPPGAARPAEGAASPARSCVRISFFSVAAGGRASCPTTVSTDASSVSALGSQRIWGCAESARVGSSSGAHGKDRGIAPETPDHAVDPEKQLPEKLRDSRETLQ